MFIASLGAAGRVSRTLHGVEQQADWDVAVIGGGPAGLAAASAAAAAGARTVVLERAEHPRYKTCGGGLMGASVAAFGGGALPARDQISAATFTLHGRRGYTRGHDKPILVMVLRDEFDDALRRRAEDAGAVLRQRTPVRGITQDGAGHARVLLADGTAVAARAVVGADGSAGISARHVGVTFGQVDLGLEQEIDVPAAVASQWRGRILLDWGQRPGSYGWVFPKGDRLTVGVIAARGQGEWTKAYLREFVTRLRLDSFPVARDSGHLTRCRTDESPLRKGRVLVAGDAAGLLEPWTREGISFALRSGALAGEAAAKAAASASSAGSGGAEAEADVEVEAALDEYAAAVGRVLVPEMRAGRVFLTAFSKHPGVFHAGLASPKGQRLFGEICRSETTYPQIVARSSARRALALLTR
jgi:geranylgeranyl reductase family protein